MMIYGANKGFHLLNRRCVQLPQSFGLGKSLSDEQRIYTLNIGEDNQLLQRGKELILKGHSKGTYVHPKFYKQAVSPFQLPVFLL